MDNGGPGSHWMRDPSHTREQYLCFLDLVERMLDYKYEIICLIGMGCNDVVCVVPIHG